MRSATLETHTEFEGVGAHELNPRFDWIDGEHDADDVVTSAGVITTPALFTARQELLTPHVRLDGIDVSHYQARVDWLRVLHIPTFWMALKVTQSIRYLDPTAANTRLSVAGLGFRHVGLYHWLSPSTDPEVQAWWFLGNIGTLRLGEFVMLDVEEAGVTVDKVLAILEAIESVIRRPVAVYTGAFTAGGTIWQSTAIRHGKFGPRPMILAAYVSEARARALPGVAAYPWSSWQFSSDGPVDGVSGQNGVPDRVDMNRVDDIPIYDRACGLIASPPTPAPDPDPTPPTPPPAPSSVPVEALGGDDMGYAAANKDARGQDTPDGHARFYVTSVAKRHIDSPEEVERLKRHGLLPADFDLANLDDPSLEWLTTAELNTYPTV